MASAPALRPTLVVACAVFALAPASAEAAAGEGASGLVLATLALVLLVARLGGHAATLVQQPPVLGELSVGILLGNLSLLGWDALEPIEHDRGVALLAEIGVLLLLFEVGLESTVGEMRRVGRSSALVAVLGVVAPFGLGWGVGALLLPDRSIYAHVFLGATLTATSVGITARVLKDLDRAASREARVILGAAVIDDVLGLVVLALVTAAVSAAAHGGEVAAAEIALIVIKAFGFLVASIVLGMWLAPRLFRVAARLRGPGVLLSASLILCFGLAWLADVFGLAPIVGAFAAGLLLERVHYRDLEVREQRPLEHMLEPISGFLVPVFFVLMGMRVDLRVFGDSSLLGLSLALTVAAIAGKQICSLGVLERGANRLAVGIGMIPRGEVGLIFANVGLGLTFGGAPILDPSVYGALVAMVLMTTIVTPPALRWSFGRSN